MAEKMSTGLCNMLLGGVSGAGSLKAIIDNNFKLFIYDGVPPASADAALAGGLTPVCIVANAGAAVTMDTAPVNGVLAKKPSETWNGTNARDGTVTFYRFQTTADPGTLSTTLPRIQGTISAGGGGDMNVGTNVLTSASVFTVNYFTQALVPS